MAEAAKLELKALLGHLRADAGKGEVGSMVAKAGRALWETLYHPVFPISPDKNQDYLVASESLKSLKMLTAPFLHCEHLHLEWECKDFWKAVSEDKLYNLAEEKYRRVLDSAIEQSRLEEIQQSFAYRFLGDVQFVVGGGLDLFLFSILPRRPEKCGQFCEICEAPLNPRTRILRSLALAGCWIRNTHKTQTKTPPMGKEEASRHCSQNSSDGDFELTTATDMMSAFMEDFLARFNEEAHSIRRREAKESAAAAKKKKKKKRSSSHGPLTTPTPPTTPIAPVAAVAKRMASPKGPKMPGPDGLTKAQRKRRAKKEAKAKAAAALAASLPLTSSQAAPTPSHDESVEKVEEAPNLASDKPEESTEIEEGSRDSSPPRSGPAEETSEAEQVLELWKEEKEREQEEEENFSGREMDDRTLANAGAERWERREEPAAVLARLLSANSPPIHTFAQLRVHLSWILSHLPKHQA